MLQEHTTLPMGAIIHGRNGERYVIEEILGHGGFSAIYRVKERYGKQNVFALKEMIDPNPHERRNLAFEAELLMRLDHPSLPKVYQVFENVRLNRIFMLMDFINGKNLEVLRHEQPDLRFSLTMALTLLTPVVDAISYLHTRKQPVVHRDIKPANIIVPSEATDALLVDFGLAKEYIEDKTTSVFRYGTPGYAAPEQYGQGTNPRTDIYALGATLYTLLTGAVPADALSRSINQHGNDPYLSADVICPTIPAPVARIIDRAMDLRNERRFTSVEEFWRELCTVTTHQQIKSPNRGTFEKIPPSRSLPRPTYTSSNQPKDQHKGPTSASEELSNSSEKPSKVIPATVHVRRILTMSQKIVLGSLLTCILLAIAIDGVFLYTLKTHPANTINTSKTVRPTSTVQRDSCSGTSPQKQTTNQSTVVYPHLCTTYKGTIADVTVSLEKTEMDMVNVKQDVANFSGDMQGLSFSGHFSGQITQNTKTGDFDLEFTVTTPTGAKKFAFTGGIRTGGDMQGSYKSYNNEGQIMDGGASGPWTVQASH